MFKQSNNKKSSLFSCFSASINANKRDIIKRSDIKYKSKDLLHDEEEKKIDTSMK